MTEPTPLTERARRVLTAAQRAAEAFGRDDLTARLVQAAERLAHPDLHALVVGEFKQGKSTLVNALLNVPVCPVSDEYATVVPTVLRHGTALQAEVVLDSGGAERRVIGMDEVPAWASERGGPAHTAVRAVEVRVPRRLLSTGLAIVDTPGVGGLRSEHGAATMAALGMAEVVIFVSDASQELSRAELDVLSAAAARCPTVVFVLTKTDLYPAWRRIADADRRHLAAAGLGHVEVVPVSSVLRQAALAVGSKELNEESGYPVLVRFLDDAVITRAQHVAVHTAVSSATFVLDQLEATFRSERSVLVDPARVQPVVDELERARGRAERLRAQSARWQQTLGDGSQDLASEIDHDLRHRLRFLSSASDEAIDQHDPAVIWDDFAAWFRREAAVHVAANAERLRTEANALAARVAEHFALDEAGVVHAVHAVHAVDAGRRTALPAELDVEFERAARGSGMLAALRGSYGGILMFGMMGQLAGLALVNPLTAVIGVGLGRRALRDERKRQLTMRRQQAKQATRKFLDELSFAVGKESRDAIRLVQRELRDEFTARAEELQRSTREALAAAEAAARSTAQDAEARVRDIDAELERLASVRRAADELAAACARPEVAA